MIDFNPEFVASNFGTLIGSYHRKYGSFLGFEIEDWQQEAAIAIVKARKSFQGGNAVGYFNVAISNRFSKLVRNARCKILNCSEVLPKKDRRADSGGIDQVNVLLDTKRVVAKLNTHERRVLEHRLQNVPVKTFCKKYEINASRYLRTLNSMKYKMVNYA